MIDKEITIKKMEDLQREVARVEFSHDFLPETIEAAIICRKKVEDLIYNLRIEPSES